MLDFPKSKKRTKSSYLSYRQHYHRIHKVKKPEYNSIDYSNITTESIKKMRNFILSSRDSLQKELINFLTTCCIIVKRNKNYFIQHIIKIRDQSARLIQKNFRISVIKKRLLTTAHRHLNYYTIYPTLDTFDITPPFDNSIDISIKLYLNLRNPNEFRIIPIRFCPIRNCYTFDIPKNKFLGKKKNMYFIFLIDGNPVIDNKYEIIKFGEENVNQIDFNLYEKENEKLENLCNEIINENKEIQNSSEDSEYIYDIENKNYDDIENIFSPLSAQKTNKNFISISKNSLEQSYTTASSFNINLCGEIKQKNPRLRKRNSILKNKNKEIKNFKTIKKSESSKSILKKVSFGIVKFSY